MRTGLNYNNGDFYKVGGSAMSPVQTVFKARVQVKKEFVSFSCFLSTTVFCTMSDRV